MATKKPTLHNKVFKISDSYLTELCRNEHIRALYHLLWVLVFLMALEAMCHDYINTRRIYLGLNTLRKGFGGIEYAFGCWCLEHLIVFFVYYGFKLWANMNSNCKRKNAAALRHILNIIALILFIALQVLITYMCYTCCLAYNLAFASAIALLAESVRFSMKMHAFVRTSAPDIGSTMDESENPNVPTFSCYLYFLYAPTLIYRSTYPRSSTPISWSFVLARLLEIIGIMFSYCFIYEHFVSVYFSDFGKQSPDLASIVMNFFHMVLPCMFVLLSLSYMVLHAVQNVFAELLHFGDRSFYKNWWTASSYETYFHTWNCLVQDWLYEYVYKDVCTYICESRFVITVVIFAVSAIAHEYVLSIAMQIFLPVMYILFGILSIVLKYTTPMLPPRLGNIFLWFSLIAGATLLMLLYSMEYFAKLNCPKEKEQLLDYLIPHIWSCMKKYV